MSTKVKREKIFPGIAGEDEVEQRRKSSRLCSAVLQGEAAEIPGGMSKKKAKEFCFKNRIGSTFPTALAIGIEKECARATTANGKALRGKKPCKRLIAAQRPDLTGTVLSIKPDKVITKGPAYIMRTLKGAPLAAVSDADKPPCRGPARQGKGGKLRTCHAELEFYPSDILKEKGITTRPGPYLRICGAKAEQPGGLYPVDSPEEAASIIEKACQISQRERLERIRNELPPAGFGGLRQRMKHRRAKVARRSRRK